MVAIGEAGLDYHYDYSPRDAQEQGFRNHIAAARETGLPLVIHSREADDDMARILEEETGKGAFPAVLHCFTGGRDLAAARDRARPLHLVHRHPDLQEIRRAARHRRGLPADRILVETDAPYLAPGRYRGKRNEPAYVVETAKVLAETRGVSPDEIARQTTENFFRLFTKVPRPARTQQVARRMTLTFTILGCGSSGGVPRPALGWGACDPDNPKNRRRRTSLLVERRNGAGVTRVLVDTSPDLREQLLDAEVDWLDGVLFTHEHADHTHGIDDLRGAVHRAGAGGSTSTSTSPRRKALRARFGYCFETPPGSEYPPIVTEHRLERRPSRHRQRGGRPDHGAARSCRSTATSPRSASASAPWPIPATSAACRRPAWRRWPASTSGSWMRCATGRTRAISASTTRWPGSSGSSRAARS